jgi:hypothetical protein
MIGEITRQLDKGLNPFNKEIVIPKMSTARMLLVGLYFFISFLYFFLLITLAILLIQHDPTPERGKVNGLTKESNAGYSVWIIVSTIICIIIQFLFALNVRNGGGVIKSCFLGNVVPWMTIVQVLSGFAICSIIIARFAPNKDNPRIIPPHSGTYNLAIFTIVFVFIYIIVSIIFFVNTAFNCKYD